MKAIIFTMLALSTGFAGCFSVNNNNIMSDTPEIPNTSAESGFAVMELFTSQGCSSCPSADALLAKYAQSGNENIIPLSFHVDYWNRLGWKDVYSDKSFSERQYKYANKIPGASVYTPQLVVNGEREMVGSETGNVSNAVTSALKKVPAVKLTISDLKKTDREISVSYSLSSLPEESIINIALVEEKTLTNIRAGENRGLNLVNYNVVRNFKTVTASSSGTEKISLPAETNGKFIVVLYLQNNSTAKVIAAVKKTV